MSLSTGDVIEGKYRIVRLIGEGGMGAVYEGENVRIHRTVAIKVLHAGVAENADAVQRFEREAQAAGRIGSEHIVEVLDLGNLPNGDRFMVMEYLDGDSLSERIQKCGRLSCEQLYPIARQILEGLGAAHGAGIIHRDLKPDNVFLLKGRRGQSDFVKLLDFGISKFSALSGESGFSMTRTGAVMGTPYYMSPEQAKGAKGMDHRADLYAVGVILYEAVTGQVPFNADTFNELLFKIVLETPPPIEQFAPDCDPAFSQIIARAMARDPGQRHQTAKELQDALDAWANGSGVAHAPANLAATPGPAIPQRTPATGGNPPNYKTGTPGTWANTGSAPFIDATAEKQSGNGLMWGAIAAGALLLVGGAFAAVRIAGGPSEDEAAQGAQAAQPSLEEIKAAAAEEAKRVAEETRKAAEEEVRKAEQKAKEAEERAKKAEASMKEQAEEEAKEAREKAEQLKQAAAAAARARPVVAPAPPKPAAPSPAAAQKKEKPATAAAPHPPAPPPAAPTPTGRKIRTEL